VGQLHGGAFIDFWNKIRETRKKINLNELNKLDILLVASNYWKRVLQNRCGVKTRIEILYNPINESFESIELKFNEQHCDNILYGGRISIDKGVLDIIESANLVLNNLECRFLLAGITLKENDLNKCKDLIKKYKLDKKVLIIGQVTEEEKIKLYEESSIFLFPSYYENFPLVIIEAAAAGLAIITTRVGALPEFFEHNKSVIFVEPGNVEQISEAILELINDAEKRRFLGKAAREVFIKKLGRKRIFESLDNIYKEVLKDI
jgi:glycosyltransferase involved in cell wall biosynthesis